MYASTRTDELAEVPWDDAVKQAFLRSQFAAQDAYYREQMPDASYDVVLVDGEEAGRLYVDRRQDEIRIVDISLLPEHRGRGHGTALLRQLFTEADASRKRVSIHVELVNPARGLYERLGFLQVEDKGVYLLMERPCA